LFAKIMELHRFSSSQHASDFQGGYVVPFPKKTTVVFLQPFELQSFNEILPAGEYEVETELNLPEVGIELPAWASSVLVRLHPRASHPGLSRTLSVPLIDLERAVAEDKRTGKTLTDFFLEEMLADPMIRLVMRADGFGESELRDLYKGRPATESGGGKASHGPDVLADGHEAQTPGLRGAPMRAGKGE
jgi:hypothetical protein